MQWPIWRKAKQEYLGLDIGSENIKLVALTVKTNQIVASQTLALPTSIASNEELSEPLLTSTIKQLVSKTNSNCRKVVTALNDKDCFTQLTTVKQSSTNCKIDALLASSANTPLPLDTLYFDFQKIANKGKYEQVLGVFCRKQLADTRVQLINASNLKLTTLEVESHAFERSFGYLYTLTSYPRCWACVLLNQSKLIILLWSYETVIGSFNIHVDTSSTPEVIINKLYRYLMQLLGTYTTHSLEALWILGEPILSSQIEMEVRKTIGLTEQPKLLKHERGIATAQTNWDNFYIAFGLALYSL